MQKKLLIRIASLLLLVGMSVSSMAAVLGENKSSVSTSKYDLDNDGKKDSVKVTFSTESEYNDIVSIKVQVGKKSLSTKVYGYSSKVEIVDIDSKDSYKEIVVSLSSDNDYQMMYIYRWNGSKVILLGEIDGGRINRKDVKFLGDGYISSYLREDILGTFERVQKYKLQTKSPYFKKVSQSIYASTGWTRTATVMKQFKAYTSMKSSKPTYTLKVGDKITCTGTDAKKWIRVKTGSGKVLYIKAASESSDYNFYSNIAGYGSMYDYLEGFDFSG